MTAAGVKADRPLAQALICRAEQLISLHPPAAGKAMRLLPRQPQVLVSGDIENWARGDTKTGPPCSQQQPCD
jgi:hypothetical protein